MKNDKKATIEAGSVEKRAQLAKTLQFINYMTKNNQATIKEWPNNSTHACEMVKHLEVCRNLLEPIIYGEKTQDLQSKPVDVEELKKEANKFAVTKLNYIENILNAERTLTAFIDHLYAKGYLNTPPQSPMMQKGKNNEHE